MQHILMSSFGPSISNIIHQSIEYLPIYDGHHWFYMAWFKRQPNTKAYEERTIFRRHIINTLCSCLSMKENKHHYGKPYLYDNVDNRHLYMGLSYSKKNMVLVLSPTIDLAIDIEDVLRHTPANLIYRICYPQSHEVGYTDSLQLWTLKEGVLKQLGVGLHVSMKKILVYRYSKHLYWAVAMFSKTDIKYCLLNYDVAYHHHVGIAYSLPRGHNAIT